MNKKVLFLAGLFFLAIVFTVFYFYKPVTTTNAGLDDFAKCLTSIGATMYGTYNCPHCLNEKKAFGSSFQYVSYVECTQEPNKCVKAGIMEVPTWIFPDGKKLVGEQGLEKLSQESGCPLPLK